IVITPRKLQRASISLLDCVAGPTRGRAWRDRRHRRPPDYIVLAPPSHSRACRHQHTEGDTESGVDGRALLDGRTHITVDESRAKKCRETRAAGFSSGFWVLRFQQ